jgi:hypothetical protein
MYGKIDRIGRNRDYERGDGGGGGSVEELITEATRLVFAMHLFLRNYAARYRG